MIRNQGFLLLLCLFVFGACDGGLYEGKGNVDLTPNDPRRIFSIIVEDDAEVALLKQQLELEPLDIQNSTLFFYEAPGLNERLLEIGYKPAQENPYQVFQRVVRIAKNGKEQELVKTGVQLINRENSYWIVRGSLAQLIALERIGYRLTTINQHEPRPREIKITAESLDDVAWLNKLQLDIFTVQESKSGYIVYGGGFDYQIDRIRDKGLKFELVDTVGQGAKR